MSRVGRSPIKIPLGVSVSFADGTLAARGPLGELAIGVPHEISLEMSGNTIRVLVTGDLQNDRAKHGLYRSLLNNVVVGVHSGFEKRLELSGVGYQCQLKSGTVELTVGYSKPVSMRVPPGLSVTCPDSTHIVVCGVDKQSVGQFAARLRSARPPDPYKAKGVKYSGEVVKRKAGKAFGAGSK